MASLTAVSHSTLLTSFSGVFPIKRADEASGSEQEKLQPACLFPEASGSEGARLVAGMRDSSPAVVTRARRHDQWPRVFHGFSGVFPIKRAGEASGSEQEKLQPACLFPEASGSEGPPLHPFTPWNTRGH